MTGCFREINFLQGSWMLLYSKACLNNCGKSVPATRKLDPSYSSYVRPPEDSEKHVVSRLDCSFCLLDGLEPMRLWFQNILALKQLCLPGVKLAGHICGKQFCLKHFEWYFMSPLCTLSVAGGMRSECQEGKKPKD